LVDHLPPREERLLSRVLRARATADYELDLTGLDLAHALASIERMVERQRFRDQARDVFLRLDPARPGGGETLFQPVGRQLLALLRQGRLTRCQPVHHDRALGYVIEMRPGRSETPSV
jgi:hypothetical protein